MYIHSPGFENVILQSQLDIVYAVIESSLSDMCHIRLLNWSDTNSVGPSVTPILKDSHTRRFLVLWYTTLGVPATVFDESRYH